MAQIIEDGFASDSAWIDLSVARFKDKRISWAFRMKELEREIEMRETDVFFIWHNRPDALDHAQGRAHLKELKRIWNCLKANPELQPGENVEPKMSRVKAVRIPGHVEVVGLQERLNAIEELVVKMATLEMPDREIGGLLDEAILRLEKTLDRSPPPL